MILHVLVGFTEVHRTARVLSLVGGRDDDGHDDDHQDDDSRQDDPPHVLLGALVVLLGLLEVLLGSLNVVL